MSDVPPRRGEEVAPAPQVAPEPEHAQVILQLQTALQRAQSTNQELALIADRVNDAILICDLRRCITWVNPAFTRLSGFSLTECHGLQPEELLSGPHTDPAKITRINQALADGDSVERLELCHHRKDGEPFWVARSVQRVVGIDGQISHHIEVLTDLTDRRRAEAERARRLEAELALADKAQFLSRMSHSMRSSLNAILGFSQLLDMSVEGLLPETQRRQIGHIHAAGQQLLTLLDQSMEYARLENRPVKRRPQRIELELLLRDIRHEVEGEALAHDIHILVDTPPLTLWADAQHTRAILLNLVRNAINFSPSGGNVWLQASPSPNEHMACIEVKDQGFGIEPGDQERIFQPFVQLDGANGRDAGHGMGLAVSQRLAELMHGHIDVRSTLGRGSVFTLRLPLAQTHAADAAAGVRHAEPAVMLPPLRVVHVEDNPMNRSLVEALFSAYPQVHLYSAETAAEGLASIEQIRPDVALVDINLPDGSGLDLCRRVRANPVVAPIPLIALSADAIPEHIARALQTGFNHYLVKPLQIQRLLSILATLPSTQAAPPSAPRGAA